VLDLTSALCRSSLFLGGSTKAFKSYGKRKTHTTNTRAHTLWNESPPPTAPALRRPISLDSDSSEEDNDDETDAFSPPKPTQKQARQKALQAVKTARAGRGNSAANDKENAVDSTSSLSSPRRAVFSKARSRIIVHSPASSSRGRRASRVKGKEKGGLEEEEDSSDKARGPFKPRFLGVHITVRDAGKLAPSSLRNQTADLSGTTSEESDEPTVARRRGGAAKRVARDSSESDGAGAVGKEKDTIDSKYSNVSLPSRRRGITRALEAAVEMLVEEDSPTSEELAAPVRTRAASKVDVLDKEDEDLGESAIEETPGLVFEDAEEEEEDQLVDHDNDDEIDQLDSSPPTSSSPEASSPPTPSASSPPGSPTATLRLPIASTSYSFPSLLSPLLSVTSNCTPFDFTSFVKSPPSPFSSNAGTRWKKIGEASYSEVFSSTGENGEEMVIKIIPVSAREDPEEENLEEGEGESEEEEEMPYMSDWSSVQREIWISDLVGGEGEGIDGFVKFKG
jgi:hypothetical protein